MLETCEEKTPFGSICLSNDLVPSAKVLVFDTHWYHRIYCDLDFDSSDYTIKLMIILFKISILELNLNVRVFNKFVEINNFLKIMFQILIVKVIELFVRNNI